MSHCKECGYDHASAVRKKELEQDRFRSYRRALYLACDGDRDKVIQLLERGDLATHANGDCERCGGPCAVYGSRLCQDCHREKPAAAGGSDG